VKRSCRIALMGMAIVVGLIASGIPVAAQTEALKEGIRRYQAEEYEEAIPLLTRARTDDPSSVVAAFFLGMAHKKLNELPMAAENLRFAASQRQSIKEAVVELIDTLQRISTPEALDEADRWIATAEGAKIAPAKVAFLKGLVRKKQNRLDDAVAAFEQALAADPSLKQAVDLQVGMTHLQQRDLGKARDRLRTAILADPQSDLATFARQYQGAIEQKIDDTLRVTVGFMGQYNTNLISKPDDPFYAGPMDNEKSWISLPSLRVAYAPLLQEPWLFSLQYAATSSLNEKFATTYDSLTQSLSVTPGYQWGPASLNLSATYAFTEKRNPSYDDYQELISVGPLVRFLLSPTHLLEVFAGYERTEFFDPALRDEEDRDADAFSAYASWIWLLGPEAFFNVRYGYSDQKTDGIWWENEGHRLSANLTWPLVEGLRLQVGGQAYFQDYRNNHLLLYNRSSRRDDTYQGTLGLAWRFLKDADLIGQYSRSEVDSNIGYYQYERDVYALGVEYTF